MSAPHMNCFQQNSNMAFLSFPPPSVPASFHVLPNGPRFPNSTSPISATNTMNSNGISSSGFSGNIPGSILRRPAPFTASNLMSPASFSMPPPTISPWGSLNNSVPQINAQQNLAQDLNPWAAPTSNNFPNSASFSQQIQSGEDIKPWVSDTGFGNNNNERSYKSAPNGSSPWNGSQENNNQHSKNLNPWSSNSPSNFTNNLQNSFEGPKKHQSQFRQARGSINDINPWSQPPPNLAGSSFQTNNSQYANGQGAPMQQNFHGKRNFQHNFNRNRGNLNNFQNGNRQWQGKSFKDQSNIKTEPNESSALSCDTCDRTFYSPEEFQAHVSEHIKCTHKNCHFEAHPKIVALHKKMQHDTGYADVINKLKNSEDIEKWRAERRRRFPTAENILKRQAEQAEKEARGEVIENKEFGKFKNKKTDQKEFRNNRSRNNRRPKKMKFSTPVSTVTVSDSDSDDDSHIKLRKFAGVFAVIEPSEKAAKETSDPVHNVSNNNNSEEAINNDTSENSQCPNESTHIESGVEEAEKSVLEITVVEDATEGSTSVNPIIIGSEEDDDTPMEIPIVKAQPLVNYNDSEDEAPIEIPLFKKPLTEISNSEVVVDKDVSASSASSKSDQKETNSDRNISRNKERNKHPNSRRNEPVGNPVKKSSLLEKLLADDIRHERNVIMQCIRHVVKKNFFGIGSNS
ncbi:hypothetical protein JTE90_011357 [Oedothorax gibbosus]|uniref:C2H2-type domain-containing protein n=1 Tax=Oedothorax gibbosus TaxID=931172 RepID=A0AAV6VK67_9ARAC|nr:hypothetical protein JTE90_011357 [Oedothorax gibbosus]